MEARKLLAELEQHGVRLTADGDNLVVRVSGGPIAPELRARLRRWKAELLLELRRVESLGGPEPPLVPVSRDEEMPLSFAQQRLWALDRIGTGPAYNIPSALRLSGRLDVVALRSSLSEIVRRHEVLRTVFESKDGLPVQRIQPATPLAFPVTDLSATPAATREAEVRRLALEDARRPFELSRGPLLRSRLVKLGEEEHVLLLTVHHIVFDGWSAGVFNSELCAHYRAFLDGAAAPLPELPVQYADFAVWQRSRLQGELLDEHLRYWTRRLTPEPPRLELPTDRPRRGGVSFEGAAHSMVFPGSLAAGLRALAQRTGTTPFVVLLAGFKVLLGRYCDTDDVSVGVPGAGRSRSELEGLIGCFANSLVMRSDLGGDPTFQALLGQVKDVAQGARQHEDLPFESIVDELNPRREAGQNPLFQVSFAFQNAPPGRLDLPGLKVSLFETDVRVTRFDLEVHLFDYPEFLGAVFAYKTVLFDATTVERMGRHYQRVLEEAVARPEARLSELSLLSADERQEVLDLGAGPAGSAPAETIQEAFEAQVARTPTAWAVEHGDEALTYRELNRRSNRLAHRLRSMGVGPDSLVGVCCERSVEMIVGLLGVLKAGGAYVPLDPRSPEKRLAFMIADTGVSVVLTQGGLEATVDGAGARVVRLDTDRDGELVAESETNPVGAATSEHLAYVNYTSGSTGRPKGVEVRHRGVMRLLFGVDYVELGPDEVFLQLAPVSFDASTFEIWGALLHGGRLVLFPDSVPAVDELARVLRSRAVTTLWLTASVFNVVIDENPQALAGVRQLLIGGEKLSVPHVSKALQHLPSTRIVNGYGPTESTTFTCCHPIPRSVGSEDGSVPIGRPIAGTETLLLDRHLNPVPQGMVGELYIGGAGLARGYVNRPRLTAERFVPHPFDHQGGARLYRTGDLGRWLPDGSIDFVGRVDDQVKIHGFRIELGEIESTLRGHPEIEHAAIVVRDQEPGDKQIAAYVVKRAGSSVTATALKDELATTLPGYMVPAAFVFLDALPLNPNGKVDAKALPAPESASTLSGESAAAAPGDHVETILAEIWSAVLGVDSVGVNDNFFDLGGHSLHLIRVHERMRERLPENGLSIVDLFRFPTIGALSAQLEPPPDLPSGRTPRPSRRTRTPSGGRDPVAIIAMAGRFPGASDVEAFWKNLRGAVESISFFGDDEQGVGGETDGPGGPRLVKAGGVLDGVDLFDAPFFGYNPREAEIMDPQQRVFLETAWEALERAGYDAGRTPLAVGVYAGLGLNRYLFQLASRPEALEAAGAYGVLIGSDKDFLPTRVSYKLNLKGPSVNVQTACSTSLVAVHMACESLRNGECDMALAGGVSIGLPQQAGYVYEEEGILSPDGHCRAFDARAKGTVPGSGVGVVVLKRLDDALDDGDSIDAVVLGSAINNDGSSKVGYTAPGLEGQAAVIARAHESADVDPETIGYVEAHGTGTVLGDPIEIAALKEAFGPAADRPATCAVGSLKTNVGHLDAAAGVAALIKVALSLRHGELAPSLHFHEANPRIEFDRSPFYVNARLADWERNGVARRAGVSSFGIGGTNAHAVLEEAPESAPGDPSRPWHVLVLSAKTASALDAASVNLAEHLASHPEQDMADVAWTLQVGRVELSHRRAIVCRSRDDADRALRSGREDERTTFETEASPGEIAFLFPGQGAQYAGMGRELYESEEGFRRRFDRCASLLESHLGVDIRPSLVSDSEELLRRTETAQPILFAFEYALACLWADWGVRPAGMIGHSLGELVAACLAGVFSLEDALWLVAERGRLMQACPPGAMLAVGLGEEELRALLNGSIDIAAVNGPGSCVASGAVDSIVALESRLEEHSVDAQRLATSHAFHSRMMEPAAEAFRKSVASVDRRPPEVPLISSVTGTWMGEEEALSPEYWAGQLRSPVKFGRGVEALLEDPRRVAVEVGPGRTLSGLVKSTFPDRLSLPSTRHPKESGSDQAVLLGALAQLWLHGTPVDWSGVHGHGRRRRVPLPTYPFERNRYWLDPAQVAGSASAEGTGVDGWFHRPVWTPSLPPAAAPRLDTSPKGGWLVFRDACGVGDRVVDSLTKAGHDVISVRPGESFARDGDGHYVVNAGRYADYDVLLADVSERGPVPRRVLHLWGITPPREALGAERGLALGFHSLVGLAQAMGNHAAGSPMDVVVATSGMQEVSNEGLEFPEKAAILGPCLVLPHEYAGWRCRAVDLTAPGPDATVETAAAWLLSEFESLEGDPVVAYRGIERFVRGFHPVRVPAVEGPPPILKQGGTYLITGGLGGIGLALAESLARVRPRLVLVGRSQFPQPAEWTGWLRRHGESEGTSRRIRQLEALMAKGAEILVVQADVASRAQMKEAVRLGERRFGPMNGVIHAAGVPGGGLVQLKASDEAESVLSPKLAGALVLDEVLRGRDLDFVLFCSSLASMLGFAGQVDYSAANACLDAVARRNASRGGPFTISVNWDTWREVGMAVETALPDDLDEARRKRLSAGEGLLSEEGRTAFERILSQRLPQVLVSASDLSARLQARPDAPVQESTPEVSGSALHPRPALATPYAAPRDELEQIIATIWGEMLGIDVVGIHDNFFDLGGHSLLATRVLNRLRATFHVSLSLQRLFEKPTVALFAGAILEAEARPGQVTEIAQLAGAIDQMSEEQIEQALADPAFTLPPSSSDV